MIEKLGPIFDDPRMDGYDRSANPERLNARQLTPNGMRWTLRGRNFEHRFADRGCFCVFPDAERFSVVDFPSVSGATAYFLGENAEVIGVPALPQGLAKRRLQPASTYRSGGDVLVIYDDLDACTQFWVSYDGTFAITGWHEAR